MAQATVCMEVQFLLYFMCNYRDLHTTALCDEGLVQISGDCSKLTKIFVKFHPIDFFPCFVWLMLLLPPVHWVHADSSCLEALLFAVFGTVLLSYYSKTKLLYKPFRE